MADWHGKVDEHCGNCDGIGCMDCVLRYWHDDCMPTCPDCFPLLKDTGRQPARHAAMAQRDQLARELEQLTGQPHLALVHDEFDDVHAGLADRRLTDTEVVDVLELFAANMADLTWKFDDGRMRMWVRVDGLFDPDGDYATHEIRHGDLPGLRDARDHAHPSSIWALLWAARQVRGGACDQFLARVPTGPVRDLFAATRAG